MTNEIALNKRKRLRKFLLALVLLIVIAIPACYYANYVYGDETPKTIKKTTLASFTANLADHRRYVRTTITLEYSSRKVEKELEVSLYRIKDVFLSVLRSKKVSDIDSSEKVEQLKEELLLSVNRQLNSGQVTGLFFEEFIIQ